MGADVDSSAHTSVIRKVLRAGGRGLRHTISNMTNLLHRPGLQPDCRITEGQVRPSVLCVTACFSGHLQSESTLRILPAHAIFDAALGKKERVQLSYVC